MFNMCGIVGASGSLWAKIPHLNKLAIGGNNVFLLDFKVKLRYN